MKRIILLAGMFIIAITLVACGDNNGDDADKDQDTGMTNNEDQDNSQDENADDDQADNNDTNADNKDNDNDEMKQKMDDLDYSEIEVEIDYGKDKEYEAEIEQDNDVIEADLEDEINGDDLNGKEAFDKIYPAVEKLTIDQDTNKEDAIKQTLDAFELDSDYEKFELELTLQDGKKIEFEDKK